MQLSARSIFKAKMFDYFRKAGKSGEDIVVTDHQRVVARIVPFKRTAPPSVVFARYRGKIKYRGDLCKDTSAEWGDK